MKPDINATMHGPIPYADGTVYLRHYNETPSGEPLVIPVTMLCNTDDEARKANIRTNAARDMPWFRSSAAHDGVAILCGSGPSIRDDLDAIKDWIDRGATVFALNGAARWLNSHDIAPHYQVMIDARRENGDLIGAANHYLLASQCHPAVIDAVETRTTLVHLLWDHLDDCLPAHDADYTVIGSAASCGPVAAFLAYAMGFRELHLYGYDSSHKSFGDSHALRQPINDGEPCAQVMWDGKTYLTSLVMKQQAEQFFNVKLALEQIGATVHVHGEGLLPDMVRTLSQIETERDKYEAMWKFDRYRAYSPALDVVDQIADFLPPGIEVLDLGCGTGKAAVALAHRGFYPVLIDFADNCRNPEAQSLPFVQADLSKPIPARSAYGYCCDVMEHIPPEQVDAVLHNIAAAVNDCFFRIETEPDVFGSLIGQRLHLSVHDDAWWHAALTKFWPNVEAKGDGVFLCRRH